MIPFVSTRQLKLFALGCAVIVVASLGIALAIQTRRLAASRDATERAKADAAHEKLIADGFADALAKKEVAPQTGKVPEGTHVGLSSSGQVGYGSTAPGAQQTYEKPTTGGKCICPVLKIDPSDLKGGCATDWSFDGPTPVVRQTWWAAVRWTDELGRLRETRRDSPLEPLRIERDSDLPLPAGPSASLPPPRRLGWEARIGIDDDVRIAGGASFYPKAWPRWIGVWVHAESRPDGLRGAGGVAFSPGSAR